MLPGLIIGVMIDKHHIWIARDLVAVGLFAVAFVSIWGRAGKQRKAEVLPEGSVAFTPNRCSFIAWPILMVYLVYVTVSLAMHTGRSPFNVLMAVCFGIGTVGAATLFPGSIIVKGDGLQQVSWLWKNKRVRWEDIVEINTGAKSRIMTITGCDGTKIVHTSVLPDRTRLLLELRHYCGDNLPSDFPREPIVGP
jgi:hypothetical protein